MFSLKHVVALATAGFVVAVATTSAWAAPNRSGWPDEYVNRQQAPFACSTDEGYGRRGSCDW